MNKNLKMCNHPIFNIASITTFIILLIVTPMYIYYTTLHPDKLIYRFILKPIPVSAMIINIVVSSSNDIFPQKCFISQNS